MTPSLFLVELHPKFPLGIWDFLLSFVDDNPASSSSSSLLCANRHGFSTQFGDGKLLRFRSRLSVQPLDSPVFNALRRPPTKNVSNPIFVFVLPP